MCRTGGCLLSRFGHFQSPLWAIHTPLSATTLIFALTAPCDPGCVVAYFGSAFGNYIGCFLDGQQPRPLIHDLLNATRGTVTVFLSIVMAPSFCYAFPCFIPQSPPCFVPVCAFLGATDFAVFVQRRITALV